MITTDISLRINEIVPGPIIVVIGIPSLVFAVQNYWIFDTKLIDGILHVIRVLFKFKFR